MSAPVIKPIFHDYEDQFIFDINVYSLEEIVSEKLRSILQHNKKFEAKGWTRSRARDYYDLWRISKDFWPTLDIPSLPMLLRKKCELKNVEFNGADSFFPEKMLEFVEESWGEWLKDLIPELPSFELVITELRPMLQKAIG